MSEFLEVVGSRRSIRWFQPWNAVPRDKVQRILEAARLTGCPGNLQPWRAIVVTQADLGEEERERLLAANNHQGPQVTAPVWIYWFADVSVIAPETFLHWTSWGLEVGMVAPQHGWSVEAAKKAIAGEEAAPRGMPALEQMVGGMTEEIAVMMAAQETNGACAVAALAAVNEGLATSLSIAASPLSRDTLYEVLGVPPTFVPVWLQLVGYPAERADGGGQRPRDPFEVLFAEGRWGSPFERDPAVVEGLRKERLFQAEAPLPGREEELEHLGRMFGFTSE